LPVPTSNPVMTPRRSSRARATQPSTAMQHTNSSSSANSLSRVERSTRSHNKLSSPRRSSTQLSQSVDDADARSKHDLPHTRQRQRDDRKDPLPPVSGEYDDEDGDDEEVTRCICGQQDYPGLPPSSRDAIAKSAVNPGIKEESALNALNTASDLLSEDAGSLFIQCDACKVWQHGGCVGIMEEAMSPDEYFCEECRKDLHKMIVNVNG
jgi:PHD-finger